MKEKNRLTVRFMAVITVSFLGLFAWTVIYFYFTLLQSNPNLARPVTLLYGVTICLGGFQLIAVSTLLFRELLLKYFEQKERVRWFHEMFIHLLSHKVGNFLLAQKLNAAILQKNYSPEAVGRINEGLLNMENDFRRILALVEAFSLDYLRRETFDIITLIDKIIKDSEMIASYHKMNPPSLIRQYFPVRVHANVLETRLLLMIVMENAFKYADGIIRVRVGMYRKRPYVAISNDLKSAKNSGTGLGLVFAYKLAQQLGVDFHYGSSKNSQFTIIIMWPKGNTFPFF